MGAVKQWMLEQHDREMRRTDGHDWRLLDEPPRCGWLRMECQSCNALATIPIRALDAKQRSMALAGCAWLIDLYYREDLPVLPYRLLRPGRGFAECPGCDPFDRDD